MNTSEQSVAVETGRRLYEPENFTAPQERPVEVEKTIEILFEAAREEVFEDGMESEFSRKLVSLVEAYGNAMLEIIAYLIVYEKVNGEVAAESLRWLGRIDHAPTYPYRLWLLERSLRCSSARVRDGATLGLASLNDPQAITPLKQAIEREQIGELREDMQQVLDQLENICPGHSF
jgi:hypothetical protein